MSKEHEHRWEVLHRIDPEASRPVLKDVVTDDKGQIVREPNGRPQLRSVLDSDGNEKLGKPKYRNSFTVEYCACGEKREVAE